MKKDHCLRDLQRLLDEDGHYQQRLKEDLDLENLTFRVKQEDGTVRTHEVTGCPQDHIASAKRKFIENLKENINSRLTYFAKHIILFKIVSFF